MLWALFCFPNLVSQIIPLAHLPSHIDKNLYEQLFSMDIPKSEETVTTSLPEGISRSTFNTMIDGQKMSATRLMTTQLKQFHNRLGKRIKMVSGGGRRSVWRCTDYINKEKQCLRYVLKMC